MLSAAAELAVATHGRDAMRAAARHLLWRRGDLSFLLHDGQIEALDLVEKSTARRIVLCIARRWGKTWGACVWACMVALRQPKARIAYAAPTGKMVENFVIPHMRLIAETAPSDLRPRLAGDKVHFPNGSFVQMQGCEDTKKADRLRGTKADAVIVDEAGFIPVLDYVVRSVLLPQTLTTRGRTLIISTPPETAAHPFAAFEREAQERGAYMHRDIYTAPHITAEQIAEYIEDAGGEQSVTWQREGLARTVTDPTKAIIPEFEAASQGEFSIVRDIPRPDHFDAYVVGDAGWTDLTVILFGYFHFVASTIVIEDELVLERTTTDVVQQHAARIEAELWGAQKPRRRILDTSERTAADLTRLQDDNDPTSEARWMVAINRDRDAAVNELRLDVQKRRVLISPRCRVTLAHLKHGVWNEKKTDFARIKQHDTSATDGVQFGHFDGVAALMYFVRHVDRNKNPNPAPPVNTATQHVPKSVRDAAERSGWADAFRRKARR